VTIYHTVSSRKTSEVATIHNGILMHLRQLDDATLSNALTM